MEVKPCNGDPPLVDSEGKEYDCGSGPERRDCPSNTYCHQTTRFARCCKKGQREVKLLIVSDRPYRLISNTNISKDNNSFY